MKGLIELNNIAVETVNSKCTTLSKTEGEGEVKVKMYGKFVSNVFFSMMPSCDENMMYSKVVELEKGYLFAKDHL